MINPLPPLPIKTPISDRNGMMHPAWIAWFREVFNRIGTQDNAIANPAAPGAVYSQAEATAVRNALVSSLEVLRTRGFIQSP